MKKVVVLSLTLLILLVLMPSSFAINSEAHVLELDNTDDAIALTNPDDNILTSTSQNDNILTSTNHYNDTITSTASNENVLNSNTNGYVASSNSENILRDSSDYYVLLIAHRYGSIIMEGADVGIERYLVDYAVADLIVAKKIER